MRRQLPAAREIKGANPTATVRQELAAADGSRDNLIDVFGRFVFSEDLLFLPIAELGGHKSGGTRGEREEVGAGEVALPTEGVHDWVSMWPSPTVRRPHRQISGTAIIGVVD